MNPLYLNGFRSLEENFYIIEAMLLTKCEIFYVLYRMASKSDHSITVLIDILLLKRFISQVPIEDLYV